MCPFNLSNAIISYFRINLGGAAIPQTSHSPAKRRKLVQSENSSPNRPEVSQGRRWSSFKAESVQQKTWEEAKAVIPMCSRKVLGLQRTREMVEKILTDERLLLRLCPHTWKVKHFHALIAAVPQSCRFKIGVTWCAEWRMYLAPYAYTKLDIKRKHGVNFQKMDIMHICHSRTAINGWEESLVDMYKTREPRRCANIKDDYDLNNQNDHTDSEDERSDGPHVLYLVHGEPIKMI